MSKRKITTTTSLTFLAVASAVLVLNWPKKVEALKPLETKTVNQTTHTLATTSPILKISGQVKSHTFLTAKTLLTTQKGNDLLVLVNKKIGLPADFVPENLVSLDGLVKTFKPEELRAEALDALEKLVTAANSDGVHLAVVSAYRSYQYQQMIFNGWVASAGLGAAENFSARPGHSQHQLGTAVDFSSTRGVSLSGDFAKSPEGVWLSQNAYKYGYILSYPSGAEAITGYSFEPWHYRYIGVDNAGKMVASGLILETFLQNYGTW